jgi:serine/threonine protein kinase
VTTRISDVFYYFLVADQNRAPLEWQSRQKIAVGAARGLRYLHEECRVGCIVHRDLRPNNILLTHDFEPLVQCFSSLISATPQ